MKKIICLWSHHTKSTGRLFRQQLSCYTWPPTMPSHFQTRW